MGQPAPYWSQEIVASHDCCCRNGDCIPAFCHSASGVSEDGCVRHRETHRIYVSCKPGADTYVINNYE